MAYYNGFPATYPGAYQTPYPAPQMPVYAPQMPNNGFQNASYPNASAQPVQQPQQQAPQMMTPPTIRAEIIQLADDTWENTVERFPLGPGASQMFMTKSEDKVIIKTMGQDGPLPLIIYDKRPPEPPAPKFDPAQFMRRDEVDKIIKDKVEMLVSAALAAQQNEQATRTAPVPTRRASKREEE